MSSAWEEHGMSTLFRVIACAVTAFLLMAADAPPTGDVVAQRGDVRLTATQLKDTLSLLDPNVRAQVTATPQALANFARERVLNMTVLAEARAKGWDNQPDIIRKMNEARDAIVLQTYLVSMVPPDPAYPSEAEIQTAYDNNKARLVAPKQYHIAQIVLLVKQGATPEEEEAVHKKALDLRALVMRPKADFADIARKNSQEPTSAAKGGDVGWLREPDMMPQVREQVAAMAENSISQLVRVPDGFHILKLLEVKPSGPVPLADARLQIVQALRQARSQRLMREYLDNVMKTQAIEVNEIALTKEMSEAK